MYEGAAGAAAGPDAALLREEVVGVAAAAAVREEQAARGRLVEVEPGTNHSSVLQPSANHRSVLQYLGTLPGQIPSSFTWEHWSANRERVSPFIIVQCLKCGSTSRHFQPGQGPSFSMITNLRMGLRLQL